MNVFLYKLLINTTKAFAGIEITIGIMLYVNK
jgi:hypothetical protein